MSKEKNMRKSKYDHIYHLLVNNGYDYDTLHYIRDSYRIKVYKGGNQHDLIWKGERDQLQEFYYIIKKYIYESSQAHEATSTARQTQVSV